MEYNLCYVFLILLVVHHSHQDFSQFINLLPIDNYTDDYAFQTSPTGTEQSLKNLKDYEPFSRHFLVTAVFTVNEFNSKWKLFTVTKGTKRILGIFFSINSEGVTNVELAINRQVRQFIIEGNYNNNSTRLIFDVSGNDVKFSVNCVDMSQSAVTPTADISNSKLSLPKDIKITFAASDSNLKGIIKELKVFPYATSDTSTVICNKYDADLTSNEAAEEDRERVEEIKNIVRTIPELKGPPGERGPPGIEGKKGEPGSRGETGPRAHNGINGTKGDRGDPGENGAPGLRGPRGDTGIQGRPGQPGLKGAPGEAGPAGKTGITGEKGPQGERGIPGENGMPGKDGSPGQKGSPGETGPRGERGEPGSTGAPGPIATLSPEEKQLLVKDLKGETGEKGEQGKQGNDGIPGHHGKDGSPGVTGPPGLRGEPGPKGPQGDKGDQGPVGIATKGDKGEVGLPGKNGMIGPRGDKGDKGDTGLVGPKGDTGNSGPPGLIGPMGPPGYNGTNGEDGQPCEEPDPIDLLKGEKGDQGIAGKDGRPGKDGKPGEHGKMGHKGNQGPIGPQGPKGPPGSPGPRGESGSPGIVVQGQKGEKGDSYFKEFSVSGYLQNDEDFQPVNTFVYATRKGLIKYNHLRVNGTMAYIEQEKKLLIKINDNTWNEIMMRPGITIGSPLSEPPTTSEVVTTTSTEATITEHVTKITTPLATTSTTERTTPLPRTTARPKPHRVPSLRNSGLIRLVAFDESHDGLIGQRNENADGKCFRLSNALIRNRFPEEKRLDAKVFRATGSTSPRHVILTKYWQLPVGNLLHRPSDVDFLFNSWRNMFSGKLNENGSKRVIYSFNGKNVLTENNTWPEKIVWSGLSGFKDNNTCKDWTTDSPQYTGTAFPLDSNIFLGSTPFPCNRKFIVLCVVITESRNKNLKYKRNTELNISNYIETGLESNDHRHRRLRRRHSRSRNRQPSLNRLDRK